VPGWVQAHPAPQQQAGSQQHLGRSGAPIARPAGGAAHPTEPPRPIYTGPLPRPSRQGFLWGLLQGVLSAVLLLVFKRDIFFYLSLLLGLFCYLFAGYLTTR